MLSTMRDFRFVATLAKGTTHPHAAMLLIDFLLSIEGQQVLEKADYLPAHPDVAPQASLAGIVPRRVGVQYSCGLCIPEVLLADISVDELPGPPLVEAVERRYGVDVELGEEIEIAV